FLALSLATTIILFLLFSFFDSFIDFFAPFSLALWNIYPACPADPQSHTKSYNSRPDHTFHSGISFQGGCQ
ncbi:MAG: hypothetical protein V3U56_03360, partial [Syntrophobacteria bacterium]